MADKSYRVGYGRPPKASQFKPGQSGNPAGRKRGSRNISTIVQEALQEQVSIAVEGRRRKVSKFEAACMQQANKAAAGDPKAMKLMFDIMGSAELRESAKAGAAISPQERHDRDKQLLAALTARIRGTEDDDGGKIDPAAVLDLVSPEERQMLLRLDLATFTQAMYEATKGGDLRWAPYLDLICSRLQDVVEGRTRRLIITMPPRHLKSFTVSTALPAFLLGRRPNASVMCVSYGQELAKEFARDFLAILKHPQYQAAFSNLLTTAKPALDVIRTVQGGVRRATSLDGTATGVGGDLIIFDDPQKPGEILSDSIRRGTNSAFENTFVSRGNQPETTAMIIVMQRLHEDDFVSHAQALGGEWEVLNLPALAEEDEVIPFTNVFGRSAFKRKQGEPLNPERISKATLAAIRKQLGEGVFATQYQQRPAPAGGGLVKISWFKRYSESEKPEAFERIVQSWDTANKTAEWNDYSVCTTWGLKGKHAYLLHVHRARLIYPDLKRAVLQQARMHNASQVFVEDCASGTQLLQELRSEGFGKLRGVKHSSDKQTRMVNQTALIENGFVHVPTAAPWLDDYLHELSVFPNGKYDDQVNSTSQALESINTWSHGGGLLEYIRQETEVAQAIDEEIWVVRSPPGAHATFDLDGVMHPPAADGLFYVKRAHALCLLRSSGWSRVS